MPLWPHQIGSLAAVRESMRSLAARRLPQRVCLVVPTGGGKTTIGAEMVLGALAKRRKALWGVHRWELADQAYDKLTSLGIPCGMMCASSAKPPQPFAPVQVGTFQSLIAREARPDAGLIIFDECHHAGARSFAGYVAQYPSTPIVGLTATPERSDGKGLGGMFEELVIGARIKELIAAGHLVSAHLIRPKRKLRSGEIAQRPVDAYLQHARGSKAIVFSPLVATAEQHAAEFRALGVPAAMVEGNTDTSERRQTWDDLRSGVLSVVTNVYVATEGFDLPAIDCVILARGFGHAGGYLQSVGRGLRWADGKTGCKVIDLQGISWDHGHPEDDRVYSLTGRGISEPSDEPRVVQRYCPVCSAPLDADALQCPECGMVLEAPPQRVTGEELVPYAWMQQDAPDARAKRLAKWMAAGAEKGHKPNAAMHKYKAVYNGWPPSSVRAAAERIMREAAAPTEQDGWT
jgi:DNA repair protein RadD